MTAMSTQPESNDRGRLPRSINKLVPTPGPDAQRITALLRDGGRISGYQLENGRILSKEEGITLAKEGGIRGLPWPNATAANTCAPCRMKKSAT